MGNTHIHHRFTVTACIAALLLGAHGAAVAAECKGMEKQSCEKNDAQCTWVDSYTRSDGVKVSGYCRSKGGKQSSSSKS